MITKREKLQYGYLFLIDLLSLVLSIGLAWGLTAGVLHKMGDFQLDDLVEACFLLLLAYILTFFTFDQSENIVNRTPIREVEIAVRFNFLLTLIDAACLALTKASMLHSRYFLVFVPVIDVFVMTGAHAVLKKMLVRSRYTKGIQSLVGVVTTQENASPILEELKNETRTIILYEAPHHLVGTLQELYQALGNRRMTLCRELTKKHETAFRTTIEDLIAFYKEQKPLGECVLVIEGRSRKEMEQESQESWKDISIEEHMTIYENQGIPRKEAMKMVAKDRGVTKRDIYQALLVQK